MLFQPKTATKLVGSSAAKRELTCPKGVEQAKVAGTNVIDLMLESARTACSQALSHLFDVMDLPRVQRKSALSRCASISVEFVSGKYWSNAAWPA